MTNQRRLSIPSVKRCEVCASEFFGTFRRIYFETPSAGIAADLPAYIRFGIWRDDRWIPLSRFRSPEMNERSAASLYHREDRGDSPTRLFAADSAGFDSCFTRLVNLGLKRVAASTSLPSIEVNYRGQFFGEFLRMLVKSSAVPATALNSSVGIKPLFDGC